MGRLLPAGCILADDREELKQQIKAASDIVEVLGSYISLRPAGPTFKGLCPFHDDRRPSFDVDPRRQRYRCWACGKFGDVISFVQEIERVSFPEALELLARRAGISLEKKRNFLQEPGRALMLDLMRWAAEQFHRCLLDSPLADSARIYLGERKLAGEIVRRFGLGFAPPQGDWLVQRAMKAGHSTDLMEKVGLIARRTEGTGYYDRFRDRVMFPIKNLRGQTVGFGGRILPSSPLSARAPKYYNSSETSLFSKSDQLYGIDQAREAAAKAGFLAVVEGYTDVLMAHQAGITPVVATMGTALNMRHVQKLRGLVPCVVLVFDADTGGATGVDRALEVFVRADLDLRIATLPKELDPCDLLVREGAEPFRQALEKAVDVFEFKLVQVMARTGEGVVEQHRAVEQMLAILALTPELRTAKMELMVNRIAHRLGLKEETLWSRLREIKAKSQKAEPAMLATGGEEEFKSGPATKLELELLEVLLAEPDLVSLAQAEINSAEIEHSGLRRLLENMYRLQDQGVKPDLDQLREHMDNDPVLASAMGMQERGLALSDRNRCFEDVLARFRQRRKLYLKNQVQHQLHVAGDHHATAIELLRQLQNQSKGP